MEYKDASMSFAKNGGVASFFGSGSSSYIAQLADNSLHHFSEKSGTYTHNWQRQEALSGIIQMEVVETTPDAEHDFEYIKTMDN